MAARRQASVSSPTRARSTTSSATSWRARSRSTFGPTYFQDVAHEQFPDNTHNTWTVARIEPGAELTFAEATPDPDDVGYPSFKFAFHYDAPNDNVECVAVYCFEDGDYTLLSADRKWSKRVPKRV